LNPTQKLADRLDGYHLSELNFPVASLTCSAKTDAPTSLLPLCLGMDDQKYSLVTAVFTVGGLAGSLGSSWLVERQGLKGGLVWVAWMNLVGVALMAFAPSWLVLAVGR
jgi:SP family facilitated glucose transporter-like MFS transporter 3